MFLHISILELVVHHVALIVTQSGKANWVQKGKSIWAFPIHFNKTRPRGYVLDLWKSSHEKIMPQEWQCNYIHIFKCLMFCHWNLVVPFTIHHHFPYIDFVPLQGYTRIVFECLWNTWLILLLHVRFMILFTHKISNIRCN